MFHPPSEVIQAQCQVLHHVSLTSKGTLKDGSFEALLGSQAYRAQHPAESRPSATPCGYLCTHMLVCTFFTLKLYSKKYLLIYNAPFMVRRRFKNTHKNSICRMAFLRFYWGCASRCLRNCSYVRGQGLQSDLEDTKRRHDGFSLLLGSLENCSVCVG